MQQRSGYSGVLIDLLLGHPHTQVLSWIAKALLTPVGPVGQSWLLLLRCLSSADEELRMLLAQYFYTFTAALARREMRYGQVLEDSEYPRITALVSLENSVLSPKDIDILCRQIRSDYYYFEVFKFYFLKLNFVYYIKKKVCKNKFNLKVDVH